MRNLRTLVMILTATAAFGLPAIGTATATDSAITAADVTTMGTANATDANPDDTPWG